MKAGIWFGTRGSEVQILSLPDQSFWIQGKIPLFLQSECPPLQRTHGWGSLIGGDLRAQERKGGPAPEGSTVLTEKLNFLPDISDPGQYQGAFALGTVTKLGKWLGWQNQFSDIYVSNPPIGTKKNDLILTTGLNFSFTH